MTFYSRMLSVIEILAPALLKILRKHNFLLNVSMLTAGTVISQGIIIICQPILTRLYTPADFGVLAVYISAVSIIEMISFCGLKDVSLIPHDNKDAINMLAASMLGPILTALLLTSLILVFPELVVRMIGQPKFSPYLLLLPAGMLLSATYKVLQSWETRNKRFYSITQTRLNRAIAGSSAQIMLGFLQIAPLGLMLGYILYSGMGSLKFAHNIWKKDHVLFKTISFKNIKRNLIVHRRFLIYTWPDSLLNIAGIQLPILIIAAAIDKSETGYLMLAMQTMALPMGIVGSSVSQVYFSEALNKLNNRTLGLFTIKTMYMLFRVGSPPLVLLGITAQFIFPLLFGMQWGRAGIVVMWMTPWFILQFIASPVSVILFATGNNMLGLFLQLFGFIIRTGIVLIATIIAKSWVVEAYALSGAIFYAIYLTMLVVVAKRQDQAYLKV
ncbi:hypothetical protein TI04_01310 [Achromatium sp. WMS2]|nr:hypothetical protein TI04_01310 [Achromatium sp. WMS2]